MGQMKHIPAAKGWMMRTRRKQVPSLKAAKSNYWPWAQSVCNICSVVCRGNWVYIKKGGTNLIRVVWGAFVFRGDYVLFSMPWRISRTVQLNLGCVFLITTLPPRPHYCLWMMTSFIFHLRVMNCLLNLVPSFNFVPRSFFIDNFHFNQKWKDCCL